MFGPGFEHIQTKQTQLHKILNIVALICFGVAMLVLLFNWGKLPETVPIHFNIKGEADGWGSKYTLFILPLITIGLYVLLTFLERKPHAFNYMVKITEDNAFRQFTLARTMMNTIKNCTMLLMSFTILSIVFDAKEASIPYNNVIISLFIATLCLLLVYFIVRSIQLK